MFSLSKPLSVDEAVNLSKIISKLSPLIGNLIEFRVAEYLNEQDPFKSSGRWRRQDPGFPDTVFEGGVSPRPGFEIKAWFPLATEITARFRESQNNLATTQPMYACSLGCQSISSTADHVLLMLLLCPRFQ